MLTDQPIFDSQIVFGMMVCAESDALVSRCLDSLLAHYPWSAVIIFLDGKMPDESFRTAVGSRATVVLGERVKKGLDHGAAIWTRFFEFTLQFNTRFIVKLDPDTLVHARLSLYPVYGSAGTLMSEGYDAQHIQGGFQIFCRRFAMAALEESKDEKYKNPDSWKCGQSNVFVERQLISTDYTLRAITRNIGGSMLSHPELDCRSLSPKEGNPFREDAKVTHPHKLK